MSIRTASFATGLFLVACSDQQTIDRPGTWHPTGANDYNLRAMIADPRDLVAGNAAATDRGSGASRAVTRLLTDRRRPLQNVTLSRVAPNSDASDPGLQTGGAGGGVGATGAPAGASGGAAQ